MGATFLRAFWRAIPYPRKLDGQIAASAPLEPGLASAQRRGRSRHLAVCWLAVRALRPDCDRQRGFDTHLSDRADRRLAVARLAHCRRDQASSAQGAILNPPPIVSA